MYRIVKILICGVVLWFVAVLVIFPSECMESGIKGVFLCIDTVIPSLFPFFVCSGIVTGLGLAAPLEKFVSPFMRPLFGVSGKGAMPFILGILSGYPVGAACIAELYEKGECSKSECEKMLAFCNNSGPLFILGAVGVGMLENPQMGRWLYVIHILSAIITGIIFKFIKTEDMEVAELPSAEKRDYTKAITEAFANAMGNMLSVCGFVVFFCVFCRALTLCGTGSMFHGFLEISGGAEQITEMSLPGDMKLVCLSGIIAFSGLSVILQVVKIAKKANLSVRLYLSGKSIQSLISMLLTYLMTKFIPMTIETAGMNYGEWEINKWGVSLWICGIILFLMVYMGKNAVDN